MKLSVPLFLGLVASATAFAPSTPLQINSAAMRSSTAFASSSTSLKVASAPPPVQSPPPTKEPEMIDENVYNFNKILIDTVYDIICFFYPVKGTKRDFARFYVLETVARV